MNLLELGKWNQVSDIVNNEFCLLKRVQMSIRKIALLLLLFACCHTYRFTTKYPLPR